MTNQLQEEMRDDIELAKRLTDITSPEMVLELCNKLIYYMDIVNQSIAESEYKTAQLKGKQRILSEYIRTAKQFSVNLSIQRQNETKKY